MATQGYPREMGAVGIEMLKDRLSAYARLAAAGGPRGEPTGGPGPGAGHGFRAEITSVTHAAAARLRLRHDSGPQ